MKNTTRMKIFNESGKGYWMEGCGCLRAEGENRPSRPNHVVLGCDLYNGQITGGIACNMNANSNASANHAGPSLLILNDQGGSVMDTSETVTMTLRAEEHGHQPVVCFEPGIMRRDCSAGNRAYIDVCSTLRAQMGDNQPAVAYPINLMVATRGGKDDMRTCFGIGRENDPQFTLSAAHEHAVCYALDHVITTGANCSAQGPCVYKNICPTEKAGGVHAVCYRKSDE